MLSKTPNMQMTEKLIFEKLPSVFEGICEKSALIIRNSLIEMN